MSDLISRKAAIKAIDDLPNCYNGYSDTYDKAYIIGVLEELPTIDVPDRKVGKWTPVSEKLPKPNELIDRVRKYYLVQNEYGDMMVATFVEFSGGAKIWQQIYQDGAIMEDIVAWMPLPKPWKGGAG